MKPRTPYAILLALLFTLLASTACKPDYPKCDNDDHCNVEGRVEYCLNQTCVQCRQDSHCGDGQRCIGGACEAIPGWCSEQSDCGTGMRCQDNVCRTGCTRDQDCSPGQLCDAGICKDQCTLDADCDPGKSCNAGRCIQSSQIGNGGNGGNSSPQSCDQLASIQFDYDESILRTDARDTLTNHADCIKQRGQAVRIEGHCDARGTEEYNIALGERRARATRDYLTSLGVRKDLITILSYGESRPLKYGDSESAYRANRRCEFVWK